MIKMENEYLVQIKGIGENNNCWRTQVSTNILKSAVRYYNFYKSGCCKRILRVRTIKKEKVVRYKKY